MSADYPEMCVQRERWEGAGAKLFYKDDGTVYRHSVYAITISIEEQHQPRHLAGLRPLVGPLWKEG